MTYKKYSKSFDDIKNIKRDFFIKDKELLSKNIQIAEIYREQPRRSCCKNCLNELNDDVFFQKQGISYYLCLNCNHLNGEHEDTEEFAKALYVEEVTDYSKTYTERANEFSERVNKIYKPKADFLFDTLLRKNVDYQKLSFVDVGAGTGFFISALNQTIDKDKVSGYEVSLNQVELGNQLLGASLINHMEINELENVISNTKSEVLSMIGVLEHLTNPRKILKAIADNDKIEYFYLSVPLFSYSVFFELVNQDCFNRHLSGGHTHLYTIESINYFCEEFGFEPIGQWQFGTDSMDLYRFIHTNLTGSQDNKKIVSFFEEKFTNVIDEIQAILDKNEFSSEIHILLKKKIA